VRTPASAAFSRPAGVMAFERSNWPRTDGEAQGREAGRLESGAAGAVAATARVGRLTGAAEPNRAGTSRCDRGSAHRRGPAERHRVDPKESRGRWPGAAGTHGDLTEQKAAGGFGPFKAPDVPERPTGRDRSPANRRSRRLAERVDPRPGGGEGCRARARVVASHRPREDASSDGQLPSARPNKEKARREPELSSARRRAAVAPIAGRRPKSTTRWAGRPALERQYDARPSGSCARWRASPRGGRGPGDARRRPLPLAAGRAQKELRPSSS